MKKQIILLSFATLFGCDDRGDTTQSITGNESGLPEELKGLKIYNVSTSGLGYVKVAVLNNEVNSLTYRNGKHDESVIMLKTPTGRTIHVTQISYENDTFIVCRKLLNQ